MKNFLRTGLIAVCLTVQGSVSSLSAQSWHSAIGTPAGRPWPAVTRINAESLHLAQANPGQPPESQAMACFSFSLSQLRFFEAIGSNCRIPLPDRLAGFVSQGVSLGESRFETLYGVEARSRLRQVVDQSLARLDAEALGVACADASQKLAETEKQLFDTVEGQSAVEGLFRKLGTMIGRHVPNSFDCE